MTCEEEIKYRESLIDKACKGIRVTPEESIWLLSHPVYNSLLGYPYYNTVIEKLKPNTRYIITIAIESVLYSKKFFPIISVPTGKGKIITDFSIVDFYNNEKKSGTPVKMLCLELEPNEEEKIKYISDLGLLSIEYECECFDNVLNINSTQSSGNGTPDFAMIREVINDHKVRYNCKSPDNDSFDALIFTVEWVENKE